MVHFSLLLIGEFWEAMVVLINHRSSWRVLGGVMRRRMKETEKKDAEK